MYTFLFILLYMHTYSMHILLSYVLRPPRLGLTARGKNVESESIRHEYKNTGRTYLSCLSYAQMDIKV